jgi:hypothetical protein
MLPVVPDGTVAIPMAIPTVLVSILVPPGTVQVTPPTVMLLNPTLLRAPSRHEHATTIRRLLVAVPSDLLEKV